MMHKKDENYRYGLLSAIKEMEFSRCVVKTKKELEKKKEKRKNSVVFLFCNFTTHVAYCLF